MKYLLWAALFVASYALFAQNQLVIPPSMSGATFQLNVQSGTKIFYTGTTTPTYGINGALLAPTLILNKGDSISLTVHNGLSVPTTMHWHGLNVAAYNDGGPNQIIAPNTSWIPSFTVRNQAGTYWYHPHGAGQTDPQVSKGLAGMIIIHDSIETSLNLPQTYGIDDIPLIVQTKAFDILQQIAISTEMDTAIFVNGTLNPYFDAPAQVVRFRLLNGSSMRSYNFGFSNNLVFYQIATEGGLKDTPVALTRLRLSPGERAEILVNFQGMNGQSLNLMSYSSALAHGIYGAMMVGVQQDTIADYNQNPLNGSDFNILKINVTSATGSPVTTIPTSLTTFNPYSLDSARTTRYLVFDTLRKLPLDRPNLADGPFGINERSFSMDSIDLTTNLNNTEIWVLKNNTYVAHPFHIHDVQFNIIEKNGAIPPASETGWKDVVLVMPQDSAKIITRFETFANSSIPYMYHCHLLHHEDDGMMGSFLVVDPNTNGINEAEGVMHFTAFPNPAGNFIQVITDASITEITITDMQGRSVVASCKEGQVNISSLRSGLYMISATNEYNQKGHLLFSKIN
jgi:blue copper oxidase